MIYAARGFWMLAGLDWGPPDRYSSVGVWVFVEGILHVRTHPQKPQSYG